MDRETVLKTLRAHEAKLKAAGMLHLRLFGSVARGDHGPAFDVDLLADDDKTKRLSIPDPVGFQYRLADLLGAEVHLTSAATIKRFVRGQALKDAVDAF